MQEFLVVGHEDFVGLVTDFLSGVRNVAELVRWLNFSDGLGAFVIRSADVEGFTLLAGAARKCMGRVVASGGGNPFAGTIAEDLVVLYGMLTTTPRHVAAAMRWYELQEK